MVVTVVSSSSSKIQPSSPAANIYKHRHHPHPSHHHHHVGGISKRQRPLAILAALATVIYIPIWMVHHYTTSTSTTIQNNNSDTHPFLLDPSSSSSITTTTTSSGRNGVFVGGIPSLVSFIAASSSSSSGMEGSSGRTSSRSGNSKNVQQRLTLAASTTTTTSDHTSDAAAAAAAFATSGASVVKDLEDRVHYLETKLNAYLSFTSDPFLSAKESAKCEHRVMIRDIACAKEKETGRVLPCELDDQSICLDQFPNAILPVVVVATAQKNKEEGGGGEPPSSSSSSASSIAQQKEKIPCVVYDYGIRRSPEFGLAFANEPFQCHVFGFDPSPITVQWWKEKEQEIKQKYPTRYTFEAIGAGGHDGPLVLREYDWGQVSIIEFPQRVVDTNNCTAEGACRYKIHEQQKTFTIPVKTLKTVMEEKGHDRIDLLKLDVEGSEYIFLEKMIDDFSCRKVDQLNLEWHHYDYDTRYGITSNPQINVLVALLKDRCGLEQFWTHGSKGWPSNQKVYQEMGMNLYYTLASFKRTVWYS